MTYYPFDIGEGKPTQIVFLLLISVQAEAHKAREKTTATKASSFATFIARFWLSMRANHM